MIITFQLIMIITMKFWLRSTKKWPGTFYVEPCLDPICWHSNFVNIQHSMSNVSTCKCGYCSGVLGVPTTVLQVETVPSSYSITALYTVLAKPTCRKWNHDRVIVTFNQILNYGIIWLLVNNVMRWILTCFCNQHFETMKFFACLSKNLWPVVIARNPSSTRFSTWKYIFVIEHCQPRLKVS